MIEETEVPEVIDTEVPEAETAIEALSNAVKALLDDEKVVLWLEENAPELLEQAKDAVAKYKGEYEEVVEEPEVEEEIEEEVEIEAPEVEIEE